MQLRERHLLDRRVAGRFNTERLRDTMVNNIFHEVFVSFQIGHILVFCFREGSFLGLDNPVYNPGKFVERGRSFYLAFARVEKRPQIFEQRSDCLFACGADIIYMYDRI